MVQPAQENARPAPPAYWSRACRHLIERDRILRKLIPQYQDEHMRTQPCPFQTLVRIIVGQQVSLPLGRKLWRHLQEACGQNLHPHCIAGFSVEQLRELGLSMRKTQYLQDAAQWFSEDNWLDAAWWHEQDDLAVIAQLGQIRGVGRWSADMFLIFFLGRPDVLPLDDTGLIKAISQHYFSGEPVSRFEAREVSQAWTPWRTVASWYLWRSMNAAAFEA